MKVKLKLEKSVGQVVKQEKLDESGECLIDCLNAWMTL